MADFQSQAMGLTGLTIDASSTAPSRTEFSQFLSDGVIDVTSKHIAVKPLDDYLFLAVSSEQTSQGLDLNGARITSVIRESGTDNDWRVCSEIHPSRQGQAVATGSMYLATTHNPVYTILDNGAVSVFPTPGSDPNAFKVYYVNNSPAETDGTALDHASTGIKWFPEDKVYLVVLYASMRSLQAKMGATTISDLSLSPVPPDVPTITAVSFTNATAGTVGEVSLAYTNTALAGTAPAYNSGSVVGFGSLLKTLSDLSITAVSPDTPSAPSFSVTTISEGTVSAGSVASVTVGTSTDVSTVALSSPSVHSNTVPSYADQSIAVARGSFNDFFESGSLNPFDDSDPTEFSVTVVPPDVPTIASISYDTASNADASATGVSTATASEMTIVDVSTNAPSYTPPVVTGDTQEITGTIVAGAIGSTGDFINFQHWYDVLADMIETEEDTELAQLQLQKIQSYITAYQAAMQNQLNNFNEGNVRYQMEFQEAVTKENQDLQVAIANANNLAQEYRQDAQQSTQIDQFNKQQDQALNLTNAAKAMEDDIADNNSKVQKYSAEIQAYQAEVGTQVQEYTQKLQRYQVELNTVYQAWVKTESDNLQLFQIEIQNELNTFNEANAVYQAALKEEAQNLQVAAGRVQQQAQIEIQEVMKQADVDMADAQKEADLNLQASIQNTANALKADIESNSKTLEKDIQEYANTLGKYGAEIQAYQADVGAQVQEWQTSTNAALQQHSQSMQDNLNLFNDANVEYQANIQHTLARIQTENNVNIQEAQIELQDKMKDADLTTQVNMQTAISNMQAIVANNQSNTSKYTAEIQAYQGEVGAAVQEYTQNLQGDGIGYQWLQDQYNRLKSEYDQAFMIQAPQQ